MCGCRVEYVGCRVRGRCLPPGVEGLEVERSGFHVTRGQGVMSAGDRVSG